MASIIKHGADTLYYIRHNMRDLPPNKIPSNIEIDPERTKQNYSIISRGKTAAQVNNYRKNQEKKYFHYNRKNLVRSIEVVATLPEDCPPDQEQAFFTETVKYVASTIPGGMDAIFSAEVHKDEGVIQADGKTVLVSPPHIHIMYIPAVKDDKHEGYEFKLCADALTKKAVLKQWHPNYQKWLNDAGVNATVHSGKTGGKNIKVSALKQITKETGLTIDEIRELKVTNEQLRTVHQSDLDKITTLKESLQSKEAAITNLQNAADRSVNMSATVADLQQKLSAEHSRAEGLQTRLELVTESNRNLRQETERQKTVITELQQELEKLRDAERTRSDWNRSKEREVSNGWGNSSGWNKEQEVKRTW